MDTDDWETIVEFALFAEADAKWRSWLQSHDIAELAPTDIRIDTGSGEIENCRRGIRRYRIRKSSMMKIKPRPVPEH